MTTSKRFRVALSFPEHRRYFVGEIAKELQSHLGQVLYDKFHEAEFAQPNLSVDLQALYREQSDLIVVFHDEGHDRRPWCGLEWRAVLDLIQQGKGELVMLTSFDDSLPPGLFPTVDGYVPIGSRTPVALVDLVLERLKLQDAKDEPAEAEPQVSQRFIDRRTTIRTFDRAIVSRFREMLREEKLSLSQNMSDVELLDDLGMLSGGFLTHAGVLLFTLHPHRILPTARMQSSVFEGTTRDSPSSRRVLTGPVQDLIEQCRSFIGVSIPREEVVNESTRRRTIYSYPMRCIREVVANALCHRDYEDDEAMCHISVFSDRVEIVNPGTWGGGASWLGLRSDSVTW